MKLVWYLLYDTYCILLIVVLLYDILLLFITLCKTDVRICTKPEIFCNFAKLMTICTKPEIFCNFFAEKIRRNLISGRWSYSICLLDEKVRLISGSIWTPVLIWGFKMMIDEIDQEIRPSTYFIYLLQLLLPPKVLITKVLTLYIFYLRILDFRQLWTPRR